MAAFVNLSFEDQGATPGLAAGWTLTQSVSWPLAGFTGAAVDGPESYEAGWSADPWETTIDSPVPAVFGDGVLVPAGVPRETYEAGADGGWDPGYVLQLSAVVGAEFNTTLDDVESYETEWAPSPQELKTEFVGIGTDLVAAVFDAGGSANTYESYEAGDGWDAGYDTVLTSPTLALFGTAGLLAPREDYESARFRQSFTVTPSLDLLNAPAHGFSDNELVQVDTTGRLPDGLSPKINYYVSLPLSDPTNRLQLSWEVAGAVIDITDPGTGTHVLVPNERKFWTEEL